MSFRTESMLRRVPLNVLLGLEMTMYSAKEEKIRFDLDEERKALPNEADKDEHFIENIMHVIWHGESLKRSDRLIEEGRLKYTHIPGVCGYVERA